MGPQVQPLGRERAASWRWREGPPARLPPRGRCAHPRCPDSHAPPPPPATPGHSGTGTPPPAPAAPGLDYSSGHLLSEPSTERPRPRPGAGSASRAAARRAGGAELLKITRSAVCRSDPSFPQPLPSAPHVPGSEAGVGAHWGREVHRLVRVPHQGLCLSAPPHTSLSQPPAAPVASARVGQQPPAMPSGHPRLASPRSPGWVPGQCPVFRKLRPHFLMQ